MRMADFLTHHREYTTVPDPYYGDYSDFIGLGKLRLSGPQLPI